MIDIGRGTPIVVIPGLQGRWEWMRPGVEALSEGHRAISYSLCDEPTSGFPVEPADGFDNYLRQVDTVLDRAVLEQATLVGVSYGGLIALEYAARRPARVSGLVLASALSPDWVPDARARFYLKAPRLLSPLFAATAPGRLGAEITAAFPRIGDRARFAFAQTVRVTRARLSPALMARRIHWAEAHDFETPDRITAPSLIVTGEPGLDRVVPVDVSRRMLGRLPDSRHAVLSRTGHLGIITRPEAFARIVDEWLTTTHGLKTGRSGGVA